jgi:hypothetical protein
MMQFTLQDDQLHSGYANNTHEEEKILVKKPGRALHPPAAVEAQPQCTKHSHAFAGRRARY